MKDYIEARVMEVARYIIDNRATVRSTAKVFRVSKSTVHKDLAHRLEHIDPVLYRRVRCILDNNLENRHIRGGDATRRKYLNLHKNGN